MSNIAVAHLINLNPDWIFSQWAHETGGFTSELCVEHNNFAGLTQSEDNGLGQPDGSCFYMRFDSAYDFAVYFSKYLLLYEGISDCSSLEDYVRCLKDGGYFGDTVENYLAGCEFWLAIIQ